MVHCPRCKKFYRNRYTLKEITKYPKAICFKCRSELLLPYLEKSIKHREYIDNLTKL